MRALKLMISMLLAAGVAACIGSPTNPEPAARLHLMLTDSPFSDARAVLVTFSAVSAHLTGNDFMPLPFAGGATSRTCDLKKLVGAQELLGTGAMPTGHYTQVRLIVTGATIYFDNPSAGPACAETIASPAGRSAAVDVHSGDVRLSREFEVTTTGSTTITVDFDGDRSIVPMGNGRYSMSPVISVVSVK